MDRTPPDTHAPTGQPPRPTLRFDWQDWLPYFAQEDAPEAQKRVLIETLWSIVVAFVDLGWQVTPVAGEPAAGSAADGPTPGRAGPGDGRETCGATIDLKAALEAAVLRSDMVDDRRMAVRDASETAADSQRIADGGKKERT